MISMDITLSRLTFNKLIVPISLILIVSSAIAQDTKVTLLSPLDGATGVHDPFTGNWEECLESGACWWPIASDNPQARAIVQWNAVDNAQEYEISFFQHSARYSQFEWHSSVWESDMTNKTSYSFGYPATQWCCQDASDQMQWKVRAIINGEPQEWSDTWIFTFQDFVYPNKNNLSDSRNIGTYSSLEQCRDAALSRISSSNWYNGDYECGLNCSGMMCEKTLKVINNEFNDSYEIPDSYDEISSYLSFDEESFRAFVLPNFKKGRITCRAIAGKTDEAEYTQKTIHSYAKSILPDDCKISITGSIIVMLKSNKYMVKKIENNKDKTDEYGLWHPLVGNYKISDIWKYIKKQYKS